MSVAGGGEEAAAVEDGVGAVVVVEEEEPEHGEAVSGNIRDSPKNFRSCGAGLHGLSVMSGPRLTEVAAVSWTMEGAFSAFVRRVLSYHSLAVSRSISQADRADSSFCEAAIAPFRSSSKMFP